MTTFPGSPKLNKGALIAVDPAGLLPLSVILFQYNPETVTRTLQPQTVGDEGVSFESQRLKGAPIETIRLEAELDAADRLEHPDANIVEMGLYPQLSALELLVYPKHTLITANTALLNMGVIEVVPPAGPLIFLVWNWPRILPVRIGEMTITEQAFDARLNPIRASVTLSLRVLSYNDLPWTHPGFTAFMAHQVIKETWGAINTVQDLGAVRWGKAKVF